MQNDIVRDILEEIQKRWFVYQRELQVYLEDRHSHWDVYNKLKELEGPVLKAKKFRGRKWYWLSEEVEWSDIEQAVDEVASWFDICDNHPIAYEHQGIRYADYAEFLVERALIKAGYTVVSKDAYYFNGRVFVRPGRGRPPDLDFIAHELKKNVFFGVEVKNKLRYPKFEELDLFLDICRVLGVKPLLVVRMAHEMQIRRVIKEGGRVVVFKQLLLKPPFPKEIFEALRFKRKFPVAVYTREPDFLVKRFIRVHSS